MPLHEKVAVLMRLHRLHEEPAPTAELVRLREELDAVLAAANRLLTAAEQRLERGH